MSQNKKKIGRKLLPRDKNGVPIGKNYKPKKTVPPPAKVKAPAPHKAAKDSGDDFMAAAARIEAETKAAAASQAPEVQAPPPPAPGAVAADPATAPVEQYPQMDWDAIIDPALMMVGGMVAAKTKIEKMQFTAEEAKKMSKAYSNLLNIMFPDLEALTSKEKAIVVAGMVTLSVAQSKALIYFSEKEAQIEKAKAQAAAKPAETAAA